MVTQDRNGTDNCGSRSMHAVSHFLWSWMRSGQKVCDLIQDLSAHPVEHASHPSPGAKEDTARNNQLPGLEAYRRNKSSGSLLWAEF